MELTNYTRNALRRSTLAALGLSAVVSGGLAADNAFDARGHIQEAIAAPDMAAAWQSYDQHTQDSNQALVLGLISFASITGFMLVEGVSRHRVMPGQLASF